MSSNKAKSKTLAAGGRNQVKASIKTLVNRDSQIFPRTWAKAVMTEGRVTAEAKFAEIARELGGISSTVAKARPNIIGTYPVAAGQTVAAGDVVDVQADGSVGKTITPVANVETVFGAVSQTAAKVCALSSDTCILLYSYNGNNNYKIADAKVAKVSNGKISVSGSFYNVVSSMNLRTGIDIVRLNDTQFVVGYVANGVRLKVGTVSDTVITFGAEFQVDNIDESITPGFTLTYLGNNKIFVYYQGNNISAFGRVFSITGSTISSAGAFTKQTGVFRDSCATLLPNDSNGNKRVCVCFTDGSDGGKGKAVIATIDSANVVTWGAVVTLFSENTGGSVYCTATKDYIFAVCRENVYVLEYNLSVKASRTLSPQYGGSSPGQESLCSDGAGNSALLAFMGRESGDSTPFSSVRCIQYDETNGIQWGELYPYNGGDSAGISVSGISSAAITNGRYILAYADFKNSNYGTATILEVSGDQIAGGFTDESSQCIALQSGEAGQEVEVIFDGVAELPGAVAGQEIMSTGVYGYCPKDGWLWVRPEWDVSFVTGSYLGTGENANKIQVGFTPSLVIVTEIKDDTKTQYAQIIMRYPAARANVVNSGSNATEFNISWDANGLTFDRTNSVGYTYHYTAFR